MLFFLNHGYRVIAHDRRGHGRSSQNGVGHDMDHYADESLEEIVAVKPTAATDSQWGGGFMSPKQFIGLVFQGV